MSSRWTRQSQSVPVHQVIKSNLAILRVVMINTQASTFKAFWCQQHCCYGLKSKMLDLAFNSVDKKKRSPERWYAKHLSVGLKSDTRGYFSNFKYTSVRFEVQ